MKNITLIGGNGQMGRLFAAYWQLQGYQVQILDRNDWNNAATLLNSCDLAVICVPINITQETISACSKHLPQSAILADFTSVKSLPLQHMLNCHSGAVLALHPMFGPTIASPHNQVIINCGGRGNYQWVIESLKDIGFSVCEMTAAQHDQAMSFIQGIEHFSTFVLGTFLKRHNQHPDWLFNLASPIYQAKLALMGRIFDQDASLYADIICADKERLNLITEYADYFKMWVNKLINNDTEDFIQEFNQAQKWMGDFTHQAQLASDQFLTAVSESFPKSTATDTD